MITIHHLWLLLKLYFHGTICIIDQFLYCALTSFTSYFNGRSSHRPLLPEDNAAVCVITGGCSGIGKQTALQLMMAGYTVIVGGRRADLPLLEDIQHMDCPGRAIGLPLDLASLDSVRQFSELFAALHLPLDLLINNGGVMFSPAGHTEDGYEVHWGVNFLSHVLLSHLLLPHMTGAKRSPHIVNIASSVHSLASPEDVVAPTAPTAHTRSNYYVEKAYINSKLAVIYGSYVLQQRLAERGVRVSCIHPGVVDTDLYKHVAWNTYAKALKAAFLMSASESGSHVVRVAVGGNGAVSRYLYYNTSRPATLPRQTHMHAPRLWTNTAPLLAHYTTLL